MDFELVRVFRQLGGGWGKSPDISEEYELRRVDCDEFHSRLPADIDDVDYRWAFDRGDTCMASLYEGVVVGWEFAASKSTHVKDGLEFVLPDGYWYSYGAFTHVDHRGQRLADARSAAWGDDSSSDSQLVWYINVKNQASMSIYGDGVEGVETIGWAAYAKFLGRYWTMRSRSCREIGVGFKGVSSPALSAESGSTLNRR